MKKSIIKTYEELEQRFRTTIKFASGPIAIVGGHYPIDQKGKAKFMPDSDRDFDSFGIFPNHTLDLAINAINYAKDIGKEAKLAVIVDDHSMMSDREWYLHDTKEAKEIKEAVEKHFVDFQLPLEFQEKMREGGLTLDDLLRSESQLPFQESEYRLKFAEKFPKELIGCAGEYGSILREIANKGFTNLIGIIPARCQGPTCNAIDQLKKMKDRMKVLHSYFVSGLHTPEEMLEITKQVYGGILLINSNVKRKG